MARQPKHPQIPPSNTWRGLCGKCGATVGPDQSKRHPIYGLVCKERCAK